MRKWLIVSWLLLLLISICIRIKVRFFNTDLIITFFDVGQGDAALIQLPQGKTILMDFGGGYRYFNMGKMSLFPELTRLGILTIDTAWLTHPDNDHARGLIGILNELKVKTLWINKGYLLKQDHSELLDQLIELAIQKNTVINAFQKTTVVSQNGVELNIWPMKVSSRGSNNNGLVLYLTYIGFRAFFSADLEKEAEKKLLSYSIKPLCLLKVGHHGSLTSSTLPFIQKTRPKYAVVSVGIKNTYHHPRAEVIERFKKHQSTLLRTDYHGFIRFRITSDGQVICETAKGSCGISNCK